MVEEKASPSGKMLDLGVTLEVTPSVNDDGEIIIKGVAKKIELTSESKDRTMLTTQSSAVHFSLKCANPREAKELIIPYNGRFIKLEINARLVK